MTTPEPGPDGKPDAAEIRSALARIVASPSFNKSPQLAHFLTFVVEETLAGRGDRIKAYTVATAALGRDASFDPQIDPIVRVEAGRLRRALEHYYAGAGRADRIVIALPLGKYFPVFRVNNKRRRAMARAVGLWRQATGLLHTNYKLLLLIAVVAALVSLAFDLFESLLFNTIIPAIESAIHSTVPPPKPPDPTGGISR